MKTVVAVILFVLAALAGLAGLAIGMVGVSYEYDPFGGGSITEAARAKRLSQDLGAAAGVLALAGIALLMS